MRDKLLVVVYKLAPLFFSFLSIILLTKFSTSEELVDFVGNYLVAVPLVAMMNTFLFFSDFTAAAENSKVVKFHPFLGYAGVTLLQLTLICWYFIGDSFYVLAGILLGFLYLLSLYLDSYIIMLDVKGGKERFELLRILLRLVYTSLVAYVVLGLDVVSGLGDGPIYGFLVVAIALIFIGFKQYSMKSIFRLTTYKVSLLFGNAFWLLPRVLFNYFEQSLELLSLAFLQSLGLAIQQALNMFYGRIISTRNSLVSLMLRWRWVTWLAAFCMVVALVFGQEGEAEYILMIIYSMAALIQVLSRARLVKDAGNEVASVIYLISLLVAFPLVSVVTYLSMSAHWVLLSLGLVLLLRSELYGKSFIFKRYVK